MRYSTLLRIALLSAWVALLPSWAFAVGPLRIETVSSNSSALTLPWIVAPSAEVSRRINDVIFNQFLDVPAPPNLQDAPAMLPQTDGPFEGTTSGTFKTLHNNGRVLVIEITAEGCGAYCEGYTAQLLFDARTGRTLETAALFTETGAQAVARYFKSTRAAKARAVIGYAKRKHTISPSELDMYLWCLSGWAEKDASLPRVELDAQGRWHLPGGHCSSHATRPWDLLDAIDVPLTNALLAMHLSAYGKSVLLGTGDVRDPAPPPPQCAHSASVRAPTGSPFLSLAQGLDHHLAVLADGRLLAWGNNSQGQLGLGQAVRQPNPAAAVVVANGLVAVAAGHDWSAALGQDGTLWTWGSNYEGSLGDGGKVNQPQPVAIGRDFIQLRAEGRNGLALKRDGSLWAWGGGYGTTPQVMGDGFMQIELGPRGEFQALKHDGTLLAWHGFSPNGHARSADTPRKLGEGFSRLAGHRLQAAFKSDGSLWAWSGSLAAMVDTGGHQDRLPQAVGSAFAQVVSAPDDFVAAIKTDGSLWLTHTRGSVTQLEPVGCGFQRVALVGTTWAGRLPDQVQVVALRDDGSLVAWPARSVASTVDGQARPSASAPMKLSEIGLQLEMTDGHWGNRGPDILFLDRKGGVWQRRAQSQSDNLVIGRDWLERIELPQP